MGQRGGQGALDRELADLPPALRWREWMRRIEAALFASAGPVPRQALARAVGEGASVDLLVADLRADLADRPYEVVAVAEGFLLRTRPAYAPAIRAAADPGDASPDLAPWDVAVLALRLIGSPGWHVSSWRPSRRGGTEAGDAGTGTRAEGDHPASPAVVQPGLRRKAFARLPAFLPVEERGG